jgi:hypothetical protein
METLETLIYLLLNGLIKILKITLDIPAVNAPSSLVLDLNEVLCIMISTSLSGLYVSASIY